MTNKFATLTTSSGAVCRCSKPPCTHILLHTTPLVAILWPHSPHGTPSRRAKASPHTTAHSSPAPNYRCSNPACSDIFKSLSPKGVARWYICATKSLVKHYTSRKPLITVTQQPSMLWYFQEPITTECWALVHIRHELSSQTLHESRTTCISLAANQHALTS